MLHEYVIIYAHTSANFRISAPQLTPLCSYAMRVGCMFLPEKNKQQLIVLELHQVHNYRISYDRQASNALIHFNFKLKLMNAYANICHKAFI